jgi:hypothetical protein
MNDVAKVLASPAWARNGEIVAPGTHTGMSNILRLQFEAANFLM